MLHDFDQIIDRRGTDSVKWDSFPEEYIPLFIADMDFAVSEKITQAVIARAKHPIYGYTRGSGELFRAFQDWFSRQYHSRPELEWLELIPGVVPALSVASSIVEGKSIATVPNYSMLLHAPERAANELITVPLKNSGEYYTMDFEALQRGLTSDTKLFYLCNPHNPVGRVYTREELLQLSEFAERNELIVVSDEIHCELVYDRPHIPFFTVSKYAKEHSVTLMSPGKTYNIPGVNLAFAIIPNPELKRRLRQAGYAFSSPGIFSMEAAIAAYRDSSQWRDELVQYLKGNRDYLESELKKRFPRAKLPHTEGTYLQWINFRGYGMQVDAEFLKETAKLIVTDGKDFGGPGYVRVNFGCPRETLTKALDRLEKALAPLA